MAKLPTLDLNAERDGVWCEHPNGFAFKIRSWYLPSVQERLEKERAIVRGSNGSGRAITGEDQRRIIAKVLAEDALADWRNVDGEATFSTDRARALLLDPKYRLVADWALGEAMNVDRFLESAAEALAGN